ncbi:hypothetical protein KIW84_057663 [Lathyrus oleraceus]|uniref:Clathrin/coatomer adaptor adaptin-like N-terminal domain-containing protein n=1 Tax=Pisum sativum TaxID=3888 RepID=A0A9D5AII1_PEA|nr:hypothetical protein KIW84_057663 [Pisum sativum]
MAPPLVTLLSAEPEIQYVALRNINLIVQRRPTILAHEIKVFFCKYNDPIYVKMEKLEIMIKLASDRNIDQVLLEFKEYATEVDVDFVRKVVRAIGRCAIKLERAAERCISVLLELIKIKVNYVVQEVIIVIKDIFRRYPNTYESIIATLCKSLDTLDEPEAKASMIWIIGEYAERIDNADELLESFLESFPEEPALVQLQFLTATVKLFLKKPTEGPQQMIQVVLNNATMETDNPDLRDLVFSFPFSRTNIKRLEIKQSSEGYHHVPGVVETKVDNIYAMWNIPQTGSDAGSIKISIDGLNITHSARDEKQLMSPTRMTPSTSGLLHGKQYKYVNSPALCLSSSNIQKHVEEPSRLSVKLNSGNATPLVSLPSLTVNVVPVDSLDGVAVKQEFIQHSIIKPSNSTVSNSKLFDSTVVKSRTDVLLLRIAHRH